MLPSKFSQLSKVGFPLTFLLSFSIFFSWDLITLKRVLNHPEYLTYYHSFRIWFLNQLRQGHFPQWNPYWGLGHSTEIEASFPIDIYSILELFVGPKYHYFFALQAFLILITGFWCFRKLKIPMLLSLLATLSFFLSPWVNYFFFYFIKANSFIGLLLCFGFTVRWIETQKKSLLPYLALSTAFALCGTKMDFWFFHLAFLFLFSSVYHFLSRRTASSFLWFALANLLGVLCHAWQLIPLFQILRVSDRLGQPPGWGALISWDFYYKLLFSLASSPFLKFLLVCTIALIGLHKKGGKQKFWLISATLTILLFHLWRSPLLTNLYGAYGLGALLAFAIWFLFSKPEARHIIATFLFFLPLSIYWIRLEPSDLSELTILHRAPLLLKSLSSFLCVWGCTQIGRNRLSTAAYLCLLSLFVMRDQGQILMAHLFGLVWIPSRDNFLFEFLFALLGVLGLRELSYRKRNSLSLACLFIVVLAPAKDYYYSHPLISPSPIGYPYYEGNPRFNHFFQKAGSKLIDRNFFVGGEYARELPMFGSALLAEVNQVHMFSSLMPKRYHDWSAFQWFGIRPEDHWSGYEGEYSRETISKLPERDTKGMETNKVYWHALHAMPPPNLNALRILGVRTLISERPLPQVAELRDYKTSGGFYSATLDFSLPRVFKMKLPLSISDKSFQAHLNPHVFRDFIQIDNHKIPYEPLPIDTYSSEFIRIHLKTAEEYRLVLLDLHHPFWHAKIDGLSTEIKPALSLFRSIEIPKGDHTIEFYCEIPFLKAGFFISLCSLFAIFSWAVIQPKAGSLPVLERGRDLIRPSCPTPA